VDIGAGILPERLHAVERGRAFPAAALRASMPAVRTRAETGRLVVVAVSASLALATPLAAQERARSQNLSALLAGRKAPADSELRELADRIDALSRSRDAQGEAALLARARAALGRARAATARSDRPADLRARQLAWAALSLCARRVALRQALRERQLAERRAARAEQALAQERDALRRAHAKRDEVAR
jgi:hypothetical protein